MKVSELYQTQKLTISFEFFPPKTDESERKLLQTVAELKALRPSFVSVTYGAMGSTRANTIRIVETIQNELGITAAAHLTCVGQTRVEIEEVLAELEERNVQNIVALRGDPPKGEKEFKPVPNGFRFSSELVGFIRSHPRFGSRFSLIVAGYPEGHLECPDKQKDLEHLKHKVDQGADVVVTQLFFDNRNFFDFARRARKIGIQVPIVPGIMPVTHGPQIQRFAAMCGAKIPNALNDAIERFGGDQAAVESCGIEYAARQCEELLKNGVPGLHFYTLNKSNATSQICRNLSRISEM